LAAGAFKTSSMKQKSKKKTKGWETSQERSDRGGNSNENRGKRSLPNPQTYSRERKSTARFERE